MSCEPEATSANVKLESGSNSPVLIVFNPTAGSRRIHLLQRALARLEALGIAYQVRNTGAAGDARSFARNADDVRIVAVAGGDGTISEAANGLVTRRQSCVSNGAAPALAIIPLGTANVLAAEIGFADMSPEAAAEAIAAGDIRPAWLGIANGHVFCQMAGVGFDAHVVAGVDLALKRRLGKLAYAIEALRQIVLYRRRLYSVDIDGIRHVAASVVVANGRFYAGRFSCAPDASIDVPGLKVCLFTRPGRWHVLRYAWGLFTSRLHRFADVEIVSGRNIHVEVLDGGDTNEPVQGDGDIVARLPVDISLAPECIGIVRPVSSVVAPQEGVSAAGNTP